MNKNKINKKQFLKTLCAAPFIGDILIDNVNSEEVYKSDFTKSDCGWNNFNDLKCFPQQDFEKLTQQIKEINSKYGHNL